MKRFSISVAINIILISVILLMAFNSSSNLTDASSSKSQVGCTNDAFYGLTADEFVKGVARYRKTHWEKINSDPYMQNGGINKQALTDARACWYSIDTLKKFICLIERYSQSLGLGSGKLGIRFYYATYPHQGVWKAEYKSRHTLFMVPTFYAEQQKANIDFDPRFCSLNNKNILQPLSQTVKGTPQMQVFGLDGESANSGAMAKNQGQLCPPTCPRGRVSSGYASILDSIDARYGSSIGYTN